MNVTSWPRRQTWAWILLFVGVVGCDTNRAQEAETAPTLQLFLSGPEGTTTVERFCDLELQVVVVNPSSESTLTIPFDGQLDLDRAPFVVRILTSPGNAVPQPDRRIVSPFDREGVYGDTLESTAVTLGPRGSTFRRVPLRSQDPLGSIWLPDGNYRLQVEYRGGATRGCPDAWTGSVVAHAFFQIRREPPALVWSEPVDGIRVALELLPGRRCFRDERLEPRIHVENVGSKRRCLYRERPGSQTDRFRFTSGEHSRSLPSVMTTGWFAYSRWVLAPGQRIVAPAFAIDLRAFEPPLESGTYRANFTADFASVEGSSPGYEPPSGVTPWAERIELPPVSVEVLTRD